MVVLEMLPPLFLWGPLPRRICAACQQSRVNVPQNCREVQCQLRGGRGRREEGREGCSGGDVQQCQTTNRDNL